MRLAIITPHAPTLKVICTSGDAPPILLNSQKSTVGIHYELVRNISIENKSLVIHDPKYDWSTCGAWFRALVGKMGWWLNMASLWNPTRFRHIWLTCRRASLKWCNAFQLMEQLPRWFLTYCASVLQLFADDTSSLCSIVSTFQDWAYEDALSEYDELVGWAMTEAGPLPTITDGGMEAAIHSPQYMPSSSSNAGSGMASPSHDAQPPHSSTHKKCGKKEKARGARPQNCTTTNRGCEKDSKVTKDKYASMYPNLQTTTIPVAPSTTTKAWTRGKPKFLEALLKEGPKGAVLRTTKIPILDERSTICKRSTSSGQSD